MKGKNQIMPPTYFYIFLVVMVVLHFIFPIKKIIFSPYTYLGWLVVVFGAGIDIWAWVLFRKKGTTMNPYKTSAKFVVEGPYRFSRHSMYLGMAMVLFGLVILLGSLVSFIFPAAFVILMEVLFVDFEEKNMEKIFGGEYVKYKNGVRRWI